MFQILIVEDDKELSQLFQKVLVKNGYQVKSASDGALALEILDKEHIDLIVSDIMMPVMDGYELVSELRSAGYQIPVEQVKYRFLLQVNGQKGNTTVFQCVLVDRKKSKIACME